jgi:hypothetical protein
VQPLKNFPAFYRTWKFITVFTRALHWFLFWARPIQSKPPHPVPPRSISVLPIHLRLGLPCDLVPSSYMSASSPFVLYVLPISSLLTWSVQLYRVFQTDLYIFESLCKCIERTCTVFWTVIMQQGTRNFTWDSYGSMWLSLVMKGVSKICLQLNSKCYCVASVTKTSTLKGVQTIHRSTPYRSTP